MSHTHTFPSAARKQGASRLVATPSGSGSRRAPRPPTRTRLATAAGLLVLAGLSATAAAQGRQETVVQTSTTVPGAVGTSIKEILFVFDFNDAGQAGFITHADDNGQGIRGAYRYSSGSFTPIALAGQPAPGTANNSFSFFYDISLNSQGQIAFTAGLPIGTSVEEGLFGSGGSFGSLAPIAVPGPGSGVDYVSEWSPINNAGQMAIRATVPGPAGSIVGGVYLGGGAALTTIAQWDQTAPGSGGQTFTSFSSPQLNGGGAVSFEARLGPAAPYDSIYRSSSGNMTLIAAEGQVAPGTGGARFGSLFNRNLNDAGQSLFSADLDYANGNTGEGLFLSNAAGTALATLAVSGQAAPGTGGGAFETFSSRPQLNQAGQVAFWAAIAGGTGGYGLYRSAAGGGLTALALSGQEAPGTGGGTFDGMVRFVRMNDHGLVSFHNRILGGNTPAAYFLTDGRETVVAQRVGQQIDGRTVAAFAKLVELGNAELNRHGQLAYYAVYEDGGNGIHVFTPDLRWRESFSGGWDSSEHWTLGITPAAVHELRIDPDTALTVTGPAGAVDVRALTVGGGAGVATLRLAGGTLGSANPVQVASNGVLTGRGTVSAEVVNAGEVRADDLVLAAGLLNRGVVRGAATGDARLQTALTNAGGGVVRTEAGQTLELVGSAHTNVGRIEVQGAMLVRGTLDNKEDGLIGLDGGRIDFSDGLGNRGVLQVEAGGAQLFGPIDNLAGGRITFTGNSTSMVNGALRVLNGAELRVAPGSTVQFFGPVDQATGSVFSGAGNKFYGGGLSVGDSPGFGRDAGNVRFGAGNVYLAEIGGTRACTLACAGNPALADGGFDKYVVDGTLILGGTLRLVSWAGMVAQEGDSFDLFDWGTLQGRFDSIDASGLTLAAGTLLDFSRLYTTGEVGVTAVPEPGTWGLMAAGLLVLGRRLRRRPAR